MTHYKIVVFRIGNEEYGIDIDQIISIEKMQYMTTLPKLPKHVRGVIELRQRVVPIVDLRNFLLEKEQEDKETNRFMVIEANHSQIGLVVDEAKNVLDISTDHIQQVSYQQDALKSIKGIVKLGEKLVILLDVSQLLMEIDPSKTLKEIQETIQAS